MGNIDSLRYVLLDRKVDSLNLVYSHQLDSLSAELAKTKIAETYFSDVLSSHSAIYGVIVACVLAFIVLGGFLYIADIRAKTLELEKNLREYEPLKQKFTDYEHKFIKIQRDALRALYEGNPKPKWKIIQHIRYCEWFYDNENPDLRERINILAAELENLKQHHTDEYNNLRNSRTAHGLRKILKKIIQQNDNQLTDKVITILSELKPDA